MIGKANKGEMLIQVQFCKTLTERLYSELLNSTEGSRSGLANHCRMQDDIKRIRRELLELEKMLDPWREGGQE